MRELRFAPFWLLLVLVFLTGACSSAAEVQEDEAQGQTDTSQVLDTTTESEPAEEAAEPEPFVREPGVVVWVSGQEPPDLHVDDPVNDLTITSWIRTPLIEGLFGVDGALAYYPELLAREPTLAVEENGSVQIDYTLRDGLQWSDGTPLTSADVEYTFAILTEGCEFEADGSIVDGGDPGCIYRKLDRSGLDLITSFTVKGESSFSITLANFFGGWRGLFDEIYAAHAFGQDAAAVNRNLQEWQGTDGPLPSSGPLIFESWDRGVSLKMARNDRYHGSTSPDATSGDPATIDGVRLSFIPDTEAQIDAVAGEVGDVIMTSPRQALQRLTDASEVTVTPTLGPAYEHLGLNVLNPHLAKPQVREALAYALDKSELVGQVFDPLFGSSLPAEGLGNTYWMTNQADYVDHQAAYTGSKVDEAKAALESSGYVLRSDGFYDHPIDGRLRLRIGTTGGNVLRERQQLLIQEQFAAAGIELTIDNVNGGAYFSERPYAAAALAAATSAGVEGDSEIWDITQFGWVGGPWPGGQSASYRAGNENNPYGFANPEFDVSASECDVVSDDDERADCYNDLDRFVSTLNETGDGLFMLPLTQRPTYFAYNSARLEAVGVAPDGRGGGPLANVADYRLG